VAKRLVQQNRSPYARPNAFHKPDAKGMGTETEVSELLAAHVRTLKPHLVVETGTFLGDTTYAMQVALDLNAGDGFPGALISFEIDREKHEAARKRVPGATIILGTLQDNVGRVSKPVDIAFVDSAYAARTRDIATLANRMAPLGLLFVHDVRMRPMLDVMRGLRTEWNVVEYATPRGLAVLQRVS